MIMKKLHLLFFFFFIAVLPYKGFGAILNVPASYYLIQDGINASSEGDTVLVDPGTYYEHLTLNGKNIVLCSWYLTTGNSAYIASTIIDGSTAGRVITINQGETSSCMIVGFTVQHGNTSYESGETNGAGIYILDASPHILNCIIQLNYAPSYGGGLSIYGSNSGAKVMNCIIQNNTAESFGGGVFMGDCGADAEITNCTISSNTITCACDWNGGGGGVNLYHTGKLTNCLIMNNSAPNSMAGGGGVHCDWGDYYGSQGIFVTGCTITNNTALNYGGVSYVITGGEFRNCIIWGNTDQYGYTSNYDGNTFTYCCSDPQPPGTGNISSDPAFVDPLPFNYRLLPGSLCINAGNNTFNTQPLDLDGNPRIKDVIDIGAYEFGSATDVTVQVGSGSDNYDQFPIYAYYVYSYTQQIYLGSEIASGGGSAGAITKIRFFYSGGSNAYSSWNNWTIYLGNTSRTEFSNSADWVPLSSLTQVFTGLIPDAVTGTWVEITLPTPFNYSGGNIVVAVDENSENWDWNVQWASFNSGSPRGLCVFDDNVNPDPASPTAANFGPDNSIAQVQFEIASGYGSLEGYVYEEPGCTLPLQGATVTTGLYSATTNASGFYHLSLPIGTYLDISAHNFNLSQTISPVFITSGNITTQDFCLPHYYAPPVSLKAAVTGPVQNNVHLSWMDPGSIADQWLHWDNGTMWGGLGYDGPATFSVASRWPVSDIAPYNGTYLKKIRFVPTEATASYTLKVWKGTDASTLLLSQLVIDPLISGWCEVTLNSPVLIDGTEELWFGYEITQTIGFPAGLGPGPAVAGKGDMINSGYGWFSVKEAWGWEFNWTLQGFVSESPAAIMMPLTPMVQNIPQQPGINTPATASVKPRVIQFEQTTSVTLPTDLPVMGSIIPNPASTISFAPASTLTGYNVYRDNVKIADNIPGLSYDDLARPKGGYDYEVAAQYDLGESSRIGPVHVDIYTCFPPTNLSVSNASLTTTAAYLSWIPSTLSTNHQWNLEWGPAGFTQGSGTTVFINSTPAYALSNLSPGTAYDFYIRTYCSSTDASAWVKKTFRTHYFNCPVNAIAEPEVCGATINNGCEQSPQATGSVNSGDTICGKAWLHRSHRDTDWYAFTLTGPSDVAFACNYEFNSNFGFYANACTSSYIYGLWNSMPGLSIVNVRINSAGTYYVYIAPAFGEEVKCDSLNRYWFSIKCNPCLTPTALNATNIASASADLGWTSNATSWKIEWGLAGFVRGTGTMINNIGSNPYHLSGLTMGYQYSYYVQGNCGSGQFSSWAGPYSFYIPCPATSLPYSNNFSAEITGTTPQCWQVKGAGVSLNWLVESSNLAGGMVPELAFKGSYYSFWNDRSYLTSPPINTTGKTSLTLSFKNYIYLYNSGTSCEIWTTSNGGVTWNSVWSLAQAGTIGPETTNLTISTPDVGSPTFQFAFAVNGYSWNVGNWEIDDISLTESSAGKSLNLNVFLEGLYSGGGTMHQAYDDLGPHFGTGITDQVTIELHNASNYAIVEYSSGLVNLGTNGNITVGSIPASLSGSYYVTIKHRNSIETVSALPVSFSGSTINYAFDNASKAYGSNMLLLIDGRWVIYGGDVNQDGIIDGGDMAPIDNLSASAASGYLVEDANGDGLVDGGDMAIVDNNSATAVSIIVP